MGLTVQRTRICMWCSIIVGIVSLLMTDASIPSILGSQMGINPFHVLKIIALICLVVAVVSFFQLKKLKNKTVFTNLI